MPKAETSKSAAMKAPEDSSKPLVKKIWPRYCINCSVVVNTNGFDIEKLSTYLLNKLHEYEKREYPKENPVSKISNYRDKIYATSKGKMAKKIIKDIIQKYIDNNQLKKIIKVIADNSDKSE
ncbi:hypothetical protein BB558_006984, partial [Smittium angustum]